MTKEARIYGGEKTIPSICGTGWATTYKRMKLKHYLTSNTKIK